MSKPEQEHWHRRLLEHRAALFGVLSVVAISVGSLVELVPLFSASLGPQALEGVTPYSPLEVAGRDIYVREGCYVCHTQMVRPMRAETLRYDGPWSRAGEYAYDRPFQLGSRRIGPDLHRVGMKYGDSWHYEHMKDPRSTSPGSIMPPYSWLHEAIVDVDHVPASMRALRTAGTPYADSEIDGAVAAYDDQAKGIVGRLAADGFEAEPHAEIVALIGYLQRLGVDGRAAIAEREAAVGGAP